MTTEATGASLRKLVAELERAAGISALTALARLRTELDALELDLVADARNKGATWQQIADELGATSRQWAQGKFGPESAAPLPGMSAAAMARRLGGHHQTVAAHPEKHGVVVKTYPGASSVRSRKRYFLQGDEESGVESEKWSPPLPQTCCTARLIETRSMHSWPADPAALQQQMGSPL